MSTITPFQARLALTTTWSDLLTVPEGEYAMFTLVQAANVDGANDVDVSLQWVDSDAVATALVHNKTLSAGPPLGLARGLILTGGDTLQGRASANLDAVLIAKGDRVSAGSPTPTPTPTGDGALDFSLDTQSGLLALLEDI